MKKVDTLKVIEYKKNRLKGYSKTKSLVNIGVKPETANAHCADLEVVKCGERELATELNDEKLVTKLKNILRLKLQLEEKIFEDAQKIKGMKQRLQVINKTKDNITEITKTLRLVEGQSTDNIKIDEAERQVRLDRIRDRLLFLSPSEN